MLLGGVGEGELRRADAELDERVEVAARHDVLAPRIELARPLRRRRLLAEVGAAQVVDEHARSGGRPLRGAARGGAPSRRAPRARAAGARAGRAGRSPPGTCARAAPRRRNRSCNRRCATRSSLAWGAEVDDALRDVGRRPVRVEHVREPPLVLTGPRFARNRRRSPRSRRGAGAAWSRQSSGRASSSAGSPRQSRAAARPRTSRRSTRGARPP